MVTMSTPTARMSARAPSTSSCRSPIPTIRPDFTTPAGLIRFALASKDRFFLLVESTDPKYDHDGTWSFLVRLGARVVSEVEH